MDPGVLDQHLDDNDGYLADLVRWDVALQCGDGSPELQYVQRVDGTAETLMPLVDEPQNSDTRSYTHRHPAATERI